MKRLNTGTQATAILFIPDTDPALHPSTECLLFIQLHCFQFKVGACEYKIMSTPNVFSSLELLSLFTLRHWVLDSAYAFPSLPSLLTRQPIPSPIFFSSLSFVLDICFDN
jgi:hypothetical protein